MSSIPLVALMGLSSTHPVQPDNAVEDAALAQRVGAGRQQQAQSAQLFPGQLQQQGVQTQLGQQAVESGALQLAQQKAINDAWKQAFVTDPDGTSHLDPNNLTSALAKSGAGAAIPAVQKGFMDMQENIQKIAKGKSDLDNLERDAAGAGAQGILSSVGPDGTVPQYARAAFFQMMHNGGYDQEAQAIQQHLQQFKNNPQGEADLWKSLVAASPAQQKLANEHLEGQAKATEAATGAAKEKFEESQGGTNVEAREMKDWLTKNPGKGPSDFLLWKSRNSPTMMLQANMGGGAADPMVDMVGQGRVDLATVLQRMPPASKQSFLTQLNAKYPGYNQGTFGIEKKVGEEFTSGDAAKNLTAFNTAIEHAKQAQAAATALDNGDVRGLNAIGNQLGYQFGSDKTTNFNVIKNAVSGEISKVFKGGQATDAEIRSVEAPFSSANSPAQLKGALNTAISLMNSKRDALKQQYEAGRQAQPNFGGGQAGNVIYARDPSGKLHSAPAGTKLPDGWKQEQR